MSDRKPVTAKQAGLIAVLFLVFIGVLLFGQGDPKTTQTAAGGTAPPSPIAATVKTDRKCQVMTIDELLRHNPFAHADSDPIVNEPQITASSTTTDLTSQQEAQSNTLRDDQRQRKIDAVLHELKTSKVKIILRTETKASAVIGDRLVHEGDNIDGVRIISILPNGVLVNVD